ncbi:CRISPR-associated protein, Cas6 family [Desulfobacula toluolica Tol2]|uniref:CRISPR-associated protein, Cas6 family n=2 Tax=Desulfobacula toluolica TaxID=28223 RepID=K0NH01_DESTT|nr:CRISPR-associated protein, Cas6 family [Desulfobacula toluolica Tol2]
MIAGFTNPEAFRKGMILRIKITAITNQPAFFPYNYQYAVHSALYSLIQESSANYSSFLHDKGYVKDGINKLFKLFTFSKLNFSPKNNGNGGFYKVSKIQFVFSTIMEKSMRHLILGIFSNQKMMLNLSGQRHFFDIVNVDIQEDCQFTNTEKFICLSPITVSSIMIKEKGKRVQHFLNYMVPAERDHFVENLKKNLINKYETINNIPYENMKFPFQFHFENNYIVKRNGRISKLIEFKNNIKVKAMEAPFYIEADPELIKIGYDCGWGEKNSAGFGCVEKAAK